MQCIRLDLALIEKSPSFRRTRRFLCSRKVKFNKRTVSEQASIRMNRKVSFGKLIRFVVEDIGFSVCEGCSSYL